MSRPLVHFQAKTKIDYYEEIKLVDDVVGGWNLSLHSL